MSMAGKSALVLFCDMNVCVQLDLIALFDPSLPLLIALAYHLYVLTLTYAINCDNAHLPVLMNTLIIMVHAKLIIIVYVPLL